jgi:hypothetical protein
MGKGKYEMEFPVELKAIEGTEQLYNWFGF